MEKNQQTVSQILSTSATNSLQIAKQEIINSEVPADKKILEALSSKKIDECDQEDIDRIIIKSVLEAFAFVGKKIDEPAKSEAKFITSALPGQLRSIVPKMRINEIPIAITRGIFKEFGEYYGINVAELVRFCKSHYESDLRSNTAKSFLKPNESPKLAPSLETQFYLYKNNLIDAFTKHNDGGLYESNAPALYDFCDKLGLIIFSTSEKWEIMKDAVKEILRENELKLFTTLEDFHRRSLIRIKENIERPFNELEKDLKIILVNKSKKLTLDAFFHEIIMSEFNISDIVDAKKNLFLNK